MLLICARIPDSARAEDFGMQTCWDGPGVNEFVLYYALCYASSVVITPVHHHHRGSVEPSPPLAPCAMCYASSVVIACVHTSLLLIQHSQRIHPFFPIFRTYIWPSRHSLSKPFVLLIISIQNKDLPCRIITSSIQNKEQNSCTVSSFFTTVHAVSHVPQI